MQRLPASELTERIRSASRESSLLKGTGLEIPKSRIQKLRKKNVWVKRDDELSFQISGPKFRKLCGLHSLFQKHDAFVTIGSMRSQFLFGFAQLCLAEGKSLEVVFLESTPWQDKGLDRYYRKLFESFPHTFVARHEWSDVEKRLPRDRFFIREGGDCEEALLGAMSLALDLLENNVLKEEGIEEIWIDAGTGLTAAALSLALGTLMIDPPTVHVVLCAGSEDEFRSRLGIEGFIPTPLVFHRPPTAKSYGSTNAKVWETIDRYLCEEGLWLDPIYTSKLFMSYEAFGRQDGRALVIHSGGGLNTLNF